MKKTLSAEREKEYRSGFYSPAETLVATASVLNEAGAKINGCEFLAKDILSQIPELGTHKGKVLFDIHRSGPGGIGLQAEDDNGGMLWAYEVSLSGKIMNSTQQVRDSREKINYLESFFNAKTIAEGLYRMMAYMADGKLTAEEVIPHINRFPPIAYFEAHPDNFTSEKCREILGGVDSVDAFKDSQFFKTIMSDAEVIRRFRLTASGRSNPWLDESAIAERVQVSGGFRRRIQGFFRSHSER